MTEPQKPGNAPKAAPADVETLRHLRVLEERLMNLRHKAQLGDEKLLAAEQKLNTELRSMGQELADMRRQLLDLRESVTVLQAEMGHTAKVHELKALEKYLGYWEPLQFVTKDELLRNRNHLNGRAER